MQDAFANPEKEEKQMKKFWNFIKNEDTSETELLFNGPI